MKKRVILTFAGILIILSLVAVSANSNDGWDSDLSIFGQTGIRCDITGDPISAEWFNITPKEGGGTEKNSLMKVFNSSGNVVGGNCSKYLKESNTACCPNNYECDIITGKCEFQPADYCSQKDKKPTCDAERGGQNSAWRFFKDMGNRFKFGVTNKSVFDEKCDSQPIRWEKGSVSCANYSRCLCEWDSNKSECESTWADFMMCGDGIEIEIGRCSYTLDRQEDRCEDLGKYFVYFNATPTSYEGCENPTVGEYPCSVTKVIPFFSFGNFIIAIVMLIGIYVFFKKE
jgi:hypothetical protein